MKPREVASRIVFRILALNVLLLFLPLATLLYIDVYEENLVLAQRQSMTELASAVSAMIAELDPETAIDRVEALPVGNDSRIRLVGAEGQILADTAGPESSAAPDHEDIPERNLLYRAASAVLRKPLQLLRGGDTVDSNGAEYEAAERIGGDEVIAALNGEPGSAKRIVRREEGASTVILYEAAPATIDSSPSAVLVSQTTHRVLDGLYDIRLRTLRIFLLSLIVAVGVSLWIAATIVRPIRALRTEAGGILDRRGRLRRGFSGSDKKDEIGELSRALERLTLRLDAFQQFNDSFASDISHEFKNPLASIRTATELLEEASDDGERRRFRDVIEREVVRMERLLESLRDVAMIDANLESEEVREVDLVRLLESLIEGYRQRERGRIEIELETEDRSATIQASEDRIYQVFGNLLDNAISFSPDGETVTVSVVSGEEGWQVSVCDRGPGVPPQHAEKVFDRFFSWRERESSSVFHSGLGLAIVRAVVEGYGGSVSLENREGGGTCATVTLS